MQTMNNLEMLTSREQLMEDIDAIVDEFTFDLPIDDIHERSQLAEDLTRVLCDAVCKNFPTNWHKLVGCPTSWIGGTRNRHSASDGVLCTHEQNTTLFWL